MTFKAGAVAFVFIHDNAKPTSNHHSQQGKQHPSPMCTTSLPPINHQNEKHKILLESRSEGARQAVQSKLPCTDDNTPVGVTKQSTTTCPQSSKIHPLQITKALRIEKKIWHQSCHHVCLCKDSSEFYKIIKKQRKAKTKFGTINLGQYRDQTSEANSYVNH